MEVVVVIIIFFIIFCLKLCNFANDTNINTYLSVNCVMIYHRQKRWMQEMSVRTISTRRVEKVALIWWR